MNTPPCPARRHWWPFRSPSQAGNRRSKLADLEPAELEKLARVVVAESLKDDLRREANLARVDYRAERDRYIARASRTGSLHTLRFYRTALERLEAWCAAQRLSPLELTPALDDDWIESEKAAGGA